MKLIRRNTSPNSSNPFSLKRSRLSRSKSTLRTPTTIRSKPDYPDPSSRIVIRGIAWGAKGKLRIYSLGELFFNSL